MKVSRSPGPAASSIALPPSALRLAVGLVLIVQAVYLLTASGHLRGQDQEYFYRMARAIAHQNTFSVEPLVFKNNEIAGARGRDGKFYTQYAPGLPTVLAPLVLLGDAMREPLAQLEPEYRWSHQGDEDIAPRVVISYFDVPVTAITAGLLTLLVIRLGYPMLAGFFTGLGFAVSTFAWGQAGMIFAEPLQGLLLLAACLLLLHASPARSLIGGCAVGAAILVKLTSVVVLPAFLLLPGENGGLLWRRRSTAVAVLVPVVIAFVIYGWYNFVRFGSWMATGYANWGGNVEYGGHGFGNPFSALYGLLLSPGRGLLWYAPLVAMAACAARQFYIERPVIGRAFAVLAIAWLAIHSAYRSWDGGWGWGPRYLLPVLPFLFVPLAAAWRSTGGRLACLGLFVLGIVVQLPGALVDFIESGREGMRVFQQICQECTEHAFISWRDFNISGSEIVRHSELLFGGKLDLAWLGFSNTWLPFVTFGLVIMLVLCGSALVIPPLLGEARAAVE